MKILQINTVYPNGSTGKIAKEIHDLCIQEQMECRIAYRYQEGNQKLADTMAISSWLDCHVHNRLAGLTMLQGCFSYFKTWGFLRKVRHYKPDIIHLHNLHGSYIHHGLLFRYLKKHRVKTVWTLHDCWPVTGGCPHFDMIGCQKWKTECHHCPQRRRAVWDASAFMHRRKKKWFSGVETMRLAANSHWTAQQAKSSFLSQYPIDVIYNGIDLSVFTPTESDFATKYGCEGKHILLGVAFGWGKKKGLDVFMELARRLPEQYQIVLVGTNEAVDAQLPPNIISIHRTHDQKELAQVYSAADLFVNPTREEAFGLVNVEALACGTPVLTFRTGGCPECMDESCGAFVDKDDIDALEREIIRICQEHPYSQEACTKRAALFERTERLRDYISLYRSL